MPPTETTSGTTTIGNGPEVDDEEPASERVTVTLSYLAVLALGFLTHRSQGGDSKTDAINKAILFYKMVKETIAKGGAIYIREPGEKEVERVKIF